MVEFALVATLLFGLVAGVVDLGLGWRRNIEVSSTLRGGARIISTIGKGRTADQEALRAISAGIAEIGAANVSRVVVYRSTSPDGKLPAACDLEPLPGGRGVSSGSGSSAVRCNIYGPEQIAALASSAARFSGSTTACQTDDWDRWYCPLNREDRQASGADFVGIHMRYRIDWMFGFMPGDGRTATDNVVMRIEPSA